MKCKHCQLPIRHYWAHIWHDDSKGLAQYCPASAKTLKSQLHEPESNTSPNRLISSAIILATTTQKEIYS